MNYYGFNDLGAGKLGEGLGSLISGIVQYNSPQAQAERALASAQTAGLRSNLGYYIDYDTRKWRSGTSDDVKAAHKVLYYDPIKKAVSHEKLPGSIMFDPNTGEEIQIDEVAPSQSAAGRQNPSRDDYLFRYLSNLAAGPTGREQMETSNAQLLPFAVPPNFNPYNAMMDIGNNWIPGFAQGGPVAAPSDTVPAMLTPGEFVMNPNAAALFGRILQAMNNMVPASPQPQVRAPARGMAGGGPIEMSLSNTPVNEYVVITDDPEPGNRIMYVDPNYMKEFAAEMEKRGRTWRLAKPGEMTGIGNSSEGDLAVPGIKGPIGPTGVDASNITPLTRIKEEKGSNSGLFLPTPKVEEDQNKKKDEEKKESRPPGDPLAPPPARLVEVSEKGKTPPRSAILPITPNASPQVPPTEPPAQPAQVSSPNYAYGMEPVIDYGMVAKMSPEEALSYLTQQARGRSTSILDQKSPLQQMLGDYQTALGTIQGRAQTTGINLDNARKAIENDMATRTVDDQIKMIKDQARKMGFDADLAGLDAALKSDSRYNELFLNKMAAEVYYTNALANSAGARAMSTTDFLKARDEAVKVANTLRDNAISDIASARTNGNKNAEEQFTYQQIQYSLLGQAIQQGRPVTVEQVRMMLKDPRFFLNPNNAKAAEDALVAKATEIASNVNNDPSFQYILSLGGAQQTSAGNDDFTAKLLQLQSMMKSMQDNYLGRKQ